MDSDFEGQGIAGNPLTVVHTGSTQLNFEYVNLSFAATTKFSYYITSNSDNMDKFLQKKYFCNNDNLSKAKLLTVTKVL